MNEVEFVDIPCPDEDVPNISIFYLFSDSIDTDTDIVKSEKSMIVKVSESDFNEPHKVIYPLGASYLQYDNRTPNELYPDTTWEYRGNIQRIPCWVRIK